MKVDKFHNYCKCGNIKYLYSKKCRECVKKNSGGSKITFYMKSFNKYHTNGQYKKYKLDKANLRYSKIKKMKGGITKK